MTAGQWQRIGELSVRGEAGIEIRLDSATREPSPNQLRAQTAAPMLATFRSRPHLGEADTGERDGHGWSWRLECARAGFEFIDIELDEPDLKGKIDAIHAAGARVVLSHHELRPNVAFETLLDRAMGFDADIVKLIGAGSAAGDFQSQRALYQRAGNRSLIHFYMGPEFAATRVLALVYGAPFVFVSDAAGHAVAPGQLTYDLMDRVYRAHAIESERLALFAVIGSPIAHSRSPIFHNEKLKALNAHSLFLALPAESARDLAQFRTTFPELRGLAVTKPMKEGAFAAATDFLDDHSSALGAVNTLLLDESAVHATNTDLLATIELLDSMGTAGPVRVLGYGGFGKAAVRASLALGLETQVCNRNPDRLREVPRGVVVLDWSERHCEGAKVLVQATAAGMHPHEDQSPLDRIPHSAQWLLETIYHPPATLLSVMARAAGLSVLDGLTLFEKQAQIQNRFFRQALSGD